MKLIIGNQKKFLKRSKTKEYIDFFSDKKINNVVILPDFDNLELFGKSKFIIGVQYFFLINEEPDNYFKIMSLKINYSLVGHSDRRTIYGETIEKFIEKINILLSKDIIPIYCFGESFRERQSGKFEDVIFSQIKEVFNKLDKEKRRKVILAYEPIWSIGTGKILDIDNIKESIKYIKELIKKEYGLDNMVLYGGSVSSKNINSLNKIDLIDGYLIGKASADKEEFLKIIEGC